MPKFAYLLGGLAFLAVWLIFFLRRKDLRKEMLVVSVIAAQVALWDFFFVPKYWQPVTLFNLPIGIEGFIFCFAFGGVGAVLYEGVFSKRLVRLGWRQRNRNLRRRFLLVIGPVLALFLHFSTPLNPMYAVLLGLLVNVFIIVALRRDLLLNTIISGSFFAGLYTLAIVLFLRVFPEALSMWPLENLSQVLLFGVPIEEILWALLAGAVAGPFYEFWQGYRLKEKQK